MKLITIIGPSGAGKDTAARILSEITHVPVIVSYTTRPMREDEQQGREHHFVSECHTPHDQLLAYTVYGGYEYWVSLDQIQPQSPPFEGVSTPSLSRVPTSSAIYVIDEEGLRDLRQRFPGINIISIYVSASKYVRMQRGVTFERIKRDDLREQFPLDYYDYRIWNNKSLDILRHALQAVADTLKQH